ncbi:MAG TPA: hypothetical protein VMW01_14995 [Williamwhitmania sp.]|nr:hypothetical protein [Williamwhitmania sp.]
MKNKFLIISLLTLVIGLVSGGMLKAQTEDELVEICGMIAKDATYLKDFKIKLDAGDPPPQYKQSIILTKNTKYRLTVCNSKDYPGKVVLQLYDNARLLGTTYVVATGKDFPFFDVTIQKTGVYHLIYSFKDGQPGLAVGTLSFVEKI